MSYKIQKTFCDTKKNMFVLKDMMDPTTGLHCLS